MTDYTKLVKALRICGKGDCVDCDRQRQDKCLKRHWNNENLIDGMLCEAAAAIEALQAELSSVIADAGARIGKAEAEVERLKEANDELREAQTYIDHYGDKWLTSAKDVPTAAYEHGYADGRAEAEAKLPKRGKWIDDEFGAKCSCCGKYAYWSKYEIPWKSPYCPLCGAKMEVQDA